ncbi:hypothetical protein DTO166G4_598 [Paecilomyces variotii]|nr:hypothetical protein DTO164E3_7827 [Paecilomyces variotii]KAJ9217794.1 hypothetical protein DTO166G4_598 [Paecilomyces variotii]KAJ9219343.1 hypothetical protein DTO169C6_8315 [Paecilomyces variotii]KAJ9228024.1 hypothetical protein DTO166G5_8916 [Paecilomyces variotii]KAJ9234568.1 hypothetical protein DTO169E5_6519 [Paecilomyces variotii]
MAPRTVRASRTWMLRLASLKLQKFRSRTAASNSITIRQAEPSTSHPGPIPLGLPSASKITFLRTMAASRSLSAFALFRPQPFISQSPSVSRWQSLVKAFLFNHDSSFTPAASSTSVNGILSGIWESILRAVPKKKTSHMKKRHRQMAGKALKDVKNLNRCSGCGQIKRAHLLCPNCVSEIRQQWRQVQKE